MEEQFEIKSEVQLPQIHLMRDLPPNLMVATYMPSDELARLIRSRLNPSPVPTDLLQDTRFTVEGIHEFDAPKRMSASQAFNSLNESFRQMSRLKPPASNWRKNRMAWLQGFDQFTSYQNRNVKKKGSPAAPVAGRNNIGHISARRGRENRSNPIR